MYCWFLPQSSAYVLVWTVGRASAITGHLTFNQRLIMKHLLRDDEHCPSGDASPRLHPRLSKKKWIKTSKNGKVIVCASYLPITSVKHEIQDNLFFNNFAYLVRCHCFIIIAGPLGDVASNIICIVYSSSFIANNWPLSERICTLARHIV